MKLAPVALLLTLSIAVSAQQKFTDPANLAGERVSPRDGRELPVDTGTLGLQQLLRKLSTRGSILNIVAHPDDEDGGMLTLYARGLGARVADLSLTRGEGGQNAMTGDFEDALGLLRTQELLANDRYTGVDQMFGTEVDFGFSKTKEEAFAKWTHERVLYDVVRAIRIYRPLVITATFIGGVTDGHGQHQVSGEIAQEAFKAAGDPAIFPELTAEGILPWQPLKVYARVPMQSITPRGLFDYATGQYTEPKFTNYVTGEVTTRPPSTDVTVHEGTPDPLLADDQGNPRSYVQFARLGLGLQKSQIGPGVRNAPSGDYDVAYHLYGSCLPDSPTLAFCHLSEQPTSLSSRPESAHSADVAERPAGPLASALLPAPFSEQPGFFTGIDTSLESIADLAPGNRRGLQPLAEISALLQRAASAFVPERPDAIAPILADALNKTDDLIHYVTVTSQPFPTREDILHELRIKRVQLNDALALALGISFDATADSANIQQDSAMTIQTSLSTAPGLGTFVEPRLQLIDQHASKEQIVQRLDRPDSYTGHPAVSQAIELPAQKNSFTATITRPYFTRGNIEAPVYKLLDPALRNAPATPAAITVGGTVDYPGVKIQAARVVHSGTQPVSIVPLASLTTVSHAQVFPRNAASILVSLVIDPPGTPVEANVPKDWKLVPNVEPTTSQRGFKQFRLEPSTSNRDVFTLSGVALLPNSQQITEGYRPVGYGDLPRTNYFTPATDRIVPVDLKLPDRRKIAYLPGTGDDVPEALASIGLRPAMLTVADLTAANLAQYDTVILGVRTYNAHPGLHGDPTQALIDYARHGGNVVVQYQTIEFTAADAPYPLALGSNEKVVDETAPVRLFEEPNDPAVRLLYAPNRISAADFNGWIEERGHGFLSTWDPHYSAPTETHDPGQNPQRGGLITVQLGDDPKHLGRWTYVAFAIYRQLPEAVPGAYRLFLNLINPD
jgi:LmbE family N-acetylglucosaminyl deacetylase